MTADEQGIVSVPGPPGRKFIGVDLDGTLAFYDKTIKAQGKGAIGPPIPVMVERVKGWIVRGDVVIIFTSRVADESNPDHRETVSRIHEWCEKHVGKRLYVTGAKWPYFHEIWDDRAVAVRENTGELVA